ncbi:MAG TPA: HAMP domain-containing sensor histidine kinase [Polyangiaceae bacterium]
MTPVSRFVRQRLHRRIFVWFGASILVTGLVVALVLGLQAQPHSGFREGLVGLRAFAAGQFERVWDDPARREQLARAASEQLGLDLVLEDARGAELGVYGRRCARAEFELPIERRGQRLGQVRVCGNRWFHSGPRWPVLLALLAAGVTLWAASGFIARRLTRPLGELVRVTGDIGAGKLATRVALHRSRYGEIGILADAINDMAGRIQKQMDDQRELLAAVSHEIRSPLARMRLSLELARDAGSRELAREQLDGMERELHEINELTGKLLASARLDFSLLDRRELLVCSLARSVLTRTGLDPEILECDPELRVVADPTLVARALSNVVENAVRHGGGPRHVRIAERGRELVFSVEDAGAGFTEADLPTVFESFVRGKSHASGTSLGLGLALVRRIALAHGGQVWARNRSPAGAEVGFSIRLARAT